MARLPKGVVALGFVSLFMDMSSEAIHALLPLFLVGTLGASAFYVGVIEGLGEATAQITKLFSGQLSERSGKRKPLAILGYGLSAVTKPLFALAGGPGGGVDREARGSGGQGHPGAPRDAMVADLVPEAQRGAAYGLRQSMDTLGALLGPALALALMWATGNVRLVFWLAIIPALVAVLVLALYVREPEAMAPPKARVALTGAALRALGRPFWGVVALGAVLTLARVSEAFLILKAGAVGLEIAWAPLVLMLFNLVYAGSAWPVGVLSDRIGARGLLGLGFGVLVLADLILAFSTGLAGVMLGVALWGLHMGMTQGVLAAQVARHAPVQMRATAFGAFNLVTGFALLVGNGLAGALWSLSGPEAAFLAGAGFALLGLVGFLRRT